MNSTPLRLVLDPVGDELVAALDCEADVFLQTYGNTMDEFADEYGSYAGATGFMTLLDQDCRALATTRFIADGPAGLKTLNDTMRPPWNVDGLRSARAVGIDPSRTWDIATVAVRRGSRGSLAAAALYHGIAAATRANGIDSIVMIVDARVRRLFSASGMQTQALPGTAEAPYLGSPSSTPVWADLRELFGPATQDEPRGLPTDQPRHRARRDLPSDRLDLASAPDVAPVLPMPRRRRPKADGSLTPGFEGPGSPPPSDDGRGR